RYAPSGDVDVDRAGAGTAGAGRAAYVLRRLSRRRRSQAPLPHPPRGRDRDHRRDHLRSHPNQHEDRSAKVRAHEMKTLLLSLCLFVVCASHSIAQPAATATLRVTVVDPTNAVIVGATVTVTGAEPAARSQSVPVA